MKCWHNAEPFFLTNMGAVDWLILAGFLLFAVVLVWVDWKWFWPKEQWRQPRKVAREVWGPMRSRYFKNRVDDTRPPEGM